MKTQLFTRKRIWEVDCWSLDAALAGSLDWRELVNLLQSNGHSFNLEKPEAILELEVQCLIHEYCHSDNPVSEKVERLLNQWHQRTLELMDEFTPSEVAEYVLTINAADKAMCAGIFWALGTDSRLGFDCIRRRFHQRFSIQSVRRLG